MNRIFGYTQTDLPKVKVDANQLELHRSAGGFLLCSVPRFTAKVYFQTGVMTWRQV
jgi:hypothetical protein